MTDACRAKARFWLISALLSWLPIGIGLGLMLPKLGGTAIDLIYPTAEVLAQLDAMSAAQKASHFWMTLTLDTLFPLSFGTVFAMTALLNWGRWSKAGAVLMCIPTLLDLTENLTVMMALKGNLSLLPLKELVSPVKFYSIQAAGIASLLTWFLAGLRKLGRR